jgi:hypothetical protein
MSLIKTLPVALAIFFTGVFLTSGSLQAQDFEVGDLDDQGRTFLYLEPLDGVYSSSWYGELTGGDGNGQTDVRIITEDKVPFEGDLRIACDQSSGHLWTRGEAEAAYSVPEDVIITARRLFCAHAGA